MNEIEKLYENAGVEKFCNSDSEFCPVAFCNECNFNIYPPFTAEKQIELIKLLAKSIIQIDNTDGEYEFSIFDGPVSDFSSFEESLADLTNRMWQSLTDVEKEQIKEILNGTT